MSWFKYLVFGFLLNLVLLSCKRSVRECNCITTSTYEYDSSLAREDSTVITEEVYVVKDYDYRIEAACEEYNNAVNWTVHGWYYYQSETNCSLN